MRLKDVIQIDLVTAGSQAYRQSALLLQGANRVPYLKLQDDRDKWALRINHLMKKRRGCTLVL